MKTNEFLITLGLLLVNIALTFTAYTLIIHAITGEFVL